MKKARLFLVMAAPVGAVAAGLVLLRMGFPATLSFEVRDAASGSWVWNSTIRLEDRVIRGFYATSYRFTRLRPGSFDMSVSAPNYEPDTVRVRLRPGRNAIAPISLVGLAIPDFSRLTVTADREAHGLELRLNPLNTKGDLIKVFPCADLRIAVRVSTQLKGGSPVFAPTAEGAERGIKLFEGKVGWAWNPAPDAVYRYNAVVPGISPDAAPYVVIDYAVLLPDLSRISPHDVDGLMDGLLQIKDTKAFAEYLRPYGDKVRMESGTLWNVRNAAGS